MKEYIEIRAKQLAEYICLHKATVRDAAKAFSVSKSTVHKDVAERLKYIDGALFEKVKDVLNINLSERHLRGGMATKAKYSKQSGGAEQTESGALS